MKKNLLLLLIVLFSFLLFAQVPDWQWVNSVGGFSGDEGQDIAIDNEGNCLVSGFFMDTVNFGPFSLTSNGLSDIFVAKIDESGNWLWATQAGGNSADHGNGIITDDTGNIYIIGDFEDTATFGTHNVTSVNSIDIFVAKMDAAGNWLWATQAGGTDLDSGAQIVSDNDGNCFVTGGFYGTAIFGPHSFTSNGWSDIFVAKINEEGNWIWALQAGGTYLDYGRAIAIDSFGNCCLTGYFSETVTFGIQTLISDYNLEVFVAKINASGSWLWANQTVGSYWNIGSGITTDYNGNSYITGFFHLTAFFGSDSLTSNGQRDIFVAKLDVDGDWLWAAQAGGNSGDYGYDIAIDNFNNCYITGFFNDIALFDSFAITSNGTYDIFVAKIDDFQNWQWAVQAGGLNTEISRGIAINNAGNSYVTGFFDGTATFGSYTITSSGSSDIFVAKVNNYVSAEDDIVSSEFGRSNFPNPFNPTTTIEFSIKNDSKIELTIYNIRGQNIKTLIHDEFTKGNHSIVWNGDDESNKLVSSGVYLYKLNVNGKTEAVRKCLLLK